MEIEGIYYVLIFLPAAAFLYASVGHGGASSYIMLLALAGFAPAQIRPTALFMNIIISFIGFQNYRGTCAFPKKLFWQLAIFSVPAAFIGGMVVIDPVIYMKILGVLLLFPVLQFMGVFPRNIFSGAPQNFWLPPLIGTLIGFLSGLIGMGGGIILSPVVLMLGWSNIRQTAAVSALFIFVNSIAGYTGTLGFNVPLDAMLWIIIPPTITAGILGSYFGANRFKAKLVKNLLTLVIAGAALKFIFLG